MALRLRRLTRADLPALVPLTDRLIGRGYYRLDDMNEVYDMSRAKGLMASWVLEDTNRSELRGLRLSFAPGQWLDHIHHACYVERWGFKPGEVGYFKSLFIDDRLRGQGWGPRLSQKSKDVLRRQGARAIVCHAWKESPENSSVRYLERFGFKALGEWPRFWNAVDYSCNGCHVKPCQCTAVEMIFKYD